MKAEPIDPIFEAHDVYELTYTRTGLRAVITGFEVGTNKPSFFEVFFPEVRGFRCLDEGDLIRYWESNQFRTGHCIYKVVEDGWLQNEVSGVLSVSSSVGAYYEFVIPTNDYCLCILASQEPIVRVYEDPYPLSKRLT
jgi:hypothetical protein